MKKKDYVIIALLIGLDQLTKYFISHRLSLFESIKVIEGFFDITYVQNNGAAWSMGEGLGMLFVGVAVLFSIGLILYGRNHKLNILDRISFVLIIAGALGNAIDRFIWGYVIDFLDFVIFGYDFPVFNVADICICVAAGFLILNIIVNKEEK